MRLVLTSMLVAAVLAIAGCGSEEDGGGTLYCCALDLLCHQSPTIEMAPCLTDMAVMNAANSGKESDCKKMLDNNDLDVHKYACDSPGHSQDCFYTEQNALDACR
jgi:hypothetical protein